MHNYSHEYKVRTKRDANGLVIKRTYQYLGSRCGTPFCPDSRKRVVLPVVKEHNDAKPGVMFGETGASVTVDK